MPIYTYECDTCGERFEAKQSFSDAALTTCPTCSGKIHRVIQPAGIVFKGSGFYVTDNRGKQNLATPGTKKDDAKPAGDTAAASTSSEGSAAPAEKSASADSGKKAAPASSASEGSKSSSATSTPSST